MASECSFSTAINLLRQATDILSASSTKINSDATSTVTPNNSNQSSDQPRLTNRPNRCVSNQTSTQVVQHSQQPVAGPSQSAASSYSNELCASTSNREQAVLSNFRILFVTTVVQLASGGGFEILRSGSNNCLILIPVPSLGYSVPYLRDHSGLGQALAYIHPLQARLDLSPAEVDQAPKVNCLQCGEEFLLTNIQSHHELCGIPNQVEIESAEDSIVEIEEVMFPNKDVPEINASLEGSGGDLEEAVAGLLSPKEATSNEGLAPSIKCLLNDYQNQRTMDHSALLLHIDRNNIWKHALIFYKSKSSVELKRPLSISFDGSNECGIDAGALKQEFFEILLRVINEDLFEGKETQRIPGRGWEKANFLKIMEL
ncbi:PREDICTED: uncharacterized protein LOC107327085 [Paramuricea clavata]|uniref:PREDICTED: uncharacterized protein LOC107327085 n=1 Tax=Paramuricea clavata TaxID=317549 RepID=A0A6S7J732_PARCT|nr:PREDICTED: uncharacterized protein LOC107327085 [Paramuricea clavata]